MVEYGAQATGPFDAPWPPGVVFPWAASLDCLGLANGNSIVSRPQVPLRATRVERRTREWSAVSSRAPLFAAGPVKWRQALADLFGAQGRNRTTDTVIFSHVLYQLSYLGDARKITGASQSGAVIGARRTPVQHAPRAAPPYWGGRAEISFKRSLSRLMTAMSLHCALLRWVHSIVTL